VAKRYNLVVVVRSRAAGAADLIERGVARLKSYGIDAKSVNDIDRLLGFPKALEDQVAIRNPYPWAQVAAEPEYVALSADQRAQVASRWQTRSKEWSGTGKLNETSLGSGNWVQVEAPGTGIGAERQKFLDAAEKGVFDLQFPTAGNWEEVATGGKPLQTSQARFGLKRFGEGADEVLQPLMSDGADGPLLGITGDNDIVGLFNPDGTYPEPERIIAAYTDLAGGAVQMQHPATWSFDVAGKSMALLEDHMVGSATAEPLAAIYPDGSRRAVLFDKSMSLIPSDRKSNPALFVQLAGGVQLPPQTYGLGPASAVITDPGGPAQHSYYTPEDWAIAQQRATGGGPRSLHVFQTAAGTSAATSVFTPTPTSGVAFVRGAAVVEEAKPDQLVRHGADGWTPWAPPAGRLAIAPQTCLSSGLSAGQRTASICTLESLFSRTGSSGQQWFTVGDVVSVDLRGEAPFTTTVTAISATTATFADPAPRSYLPGTVVQFVHAGTLPLPPTTSIPPAASPPSNVEIPQATGSGTGAAATPSATTGELPRTGAPLGLWTLFALVLLAGGAGLLSIGRLQRRRTTH
jgi:hypothetical protein